MLAAKEASEQNCAEAVIPHPTCCVTSNWLKLGGYVEFVFFVLLMLLYDLGTESCADLFACFSQHSCGKEANVFAGPFHHWCCYEPLKI